MKTHTIKCWPKFFEPLWDGTKTFEVRKNDRGYQVGDLLTINEYRPAPRIYTGRALRFEIVYLLPDTDFEGICQGHCVIGLKPNNKIESTPQQDPF